MGGCSAWTISSRAPSSWACSKAAARVEWFTRLVLSPTPISFLFPTSCGWAAAEITSTGQRELATTETLVEPTNIRSNPETERRPTTIRSATSLSLPSTPPGEPRTTSVRMRSSGRPISRALAAAASLALTPAFCSTSGS